jgi:hypothetical protein
MKPPATIKISDDYVSIESPYNAKFVDALKELIPAEDRMWNATDKVWEVSGDLYDEALAITSRFYNVKVDIVTS